MSRRRQHSLWFGAIALAVIWLCAGAGFQFSRRTKFTADKLRRHTESLNWSALSGAARSNALQELASRWNRLPYEERRRAWLRREWERPFAFLSESEQEQFLEATLARDIPPMTAAFARWPVEQRQKMLERAFRRLEEARETL